MNSHILKFSLKSQLWIRIAGHNTSFGYSSLPKNMHFTVAYNDNSTDINLHISRNDSNGDKAKLEIARISKQDAQYVVEKIIPRLIIGRLKATTNEFASKSLYMVRFESQHHCCKNLDRLLYNTMSNEFSKKMSIKKNDFKYNGSISEAETQLAKIIRTRLFQRKLKQNFVSTKILQYIKNRSGFYYQKDGSAVPIIDVNGTLYIMRLDFNMFKWLLRIVKKKTLRDILGRIVKSINILSHSHKDETAPCNGIMLKIKKMANSSVNPMARSSHRPSAPGGNSA